MLLIKITSSVHLLEDQKTYIVDELCKFFDTYRQYCGAEVLFVFKESKSRLKITFDEEDRKNGFYCYKELPQDWDFKSEFDTVMEMAHEYIHEQRRKGLVEDVPKEERKKLGAGFHHSPGWML